MAKAALRQKEDAAAMSDADGAPASRRPVHEQMKADVLSLALQPGQDLDEVSLNLRYGVSRTPIREALEAE